MDRTKEQLRQIVFENLMRLPAYKLKDTQQKIFREYELADLNRLIKNERLQKYNVENKKYDSVNKTITKYKKHNWLNTFLLSLRLLDNRYKLLALIAVVSYIFAFLVRVNNLHLILIGFGCFFIFIFSFLVSAIQFSLWYSYVNSTFSLINRNIDDVEDYINAFESINESSLQVKAHMITENIVTTEISGLSYDLRRFDIFNILFAFFLSWLFVYIFGNTFIEEIQWIANFFNFGNFEVIKNLNTETFVFLILIPVGIPLSKYIIVSGLKERHKRLQQSIVIVKNFIKTDIVNTVSTASKENTEHSNQSAIIKLFGTIEYEDDYDYKKQRRNL